MSDVIERRGTRKEKAKAPKPVPRPDRRFYATTKAFGRFGIRWFDPQLMPSEHWHGHIEFNWLTEGGMGYLFDGRPVEIPPQRLVMFWAGIPHRTVSTDRGRSGEARQCNIYLPLDTFLYMPNLGRLTETMIGGGVIALPDDAVDNALLERWYQDYRSGDAERTDILKSEIANMLRRTTLVGWEELLPPWIETLEPVTRTASPLSYVVAMVRYIHENLAEPISSRDIARVVGLHPNYALNLFTRVMRIPVRRFVIRMRLIRARALLFEGNLSIANAAFQSGFASLSQFYAHFRAAYGMTPLEMRRNLVASGKLSGKPGKDTWTDCQRDAV
ncbi:helix-turn-helix domain-containing protein [Chelativorans xinjiangense]|uniref:helix-turn-helix domain-containing protein n=1 Tax=Chelativorans xinjiangense TaxID=2681485 RepID=UPI001359A5FC|nr:helix-turn-helix domain-containing protein [Chelativorans xinjiangense]